ncbi:MAG: hypothetical protein GY839_08010 [candidate division Zixibacteria bacterium]|nr:hypothetical protein [candidate division Zixibacteria bacterium]
MKTSGWMLVYGLLIPRGTLTIALIPAGVLERQSSHKATTRQAGASSFAKAAAQQAGVLRETAEAFWEDYDHRGSAGRYLAPGRKQVDDAALGNRFDVMASRGVRYEARLLNGSLGIDAPAFRSRTGLSRGAGRACRLRGAPCNRSLFTDVKLIS